ncbi:transglutaminase family protein [Yoonia sp. 2307UL14-13]|uniref:transglutaminase family protein n=1 Tax=Yoonia sp. 2307UL14-13 TaxID=3126506 RepID=UPI00309C825E
MRLKIKHTTSYTYDAPVSYGLQQVRLTPTDNAMQRVLNWKVSITGGREELSFADHFKNLTILLQADPEQTAVEVTAEGEIETRDTNGILGKVYDAAPLWLFQQPTPRTTPGRGIRKLTKVVGGGDDLLSSLHDLSKAIVDAVPYGLGDTGTRTTAEEALGAGRGVCQDHAQIFITAAREAGVPARYVSGYLMLNDRVDQDASHAWAEAHLDDLGWVGFDVSNGISPDERYVRVAIGRDSRDAAPISGMRLGNADEAMIVALQVQQ